MKIKTTDMTLLQRAQSEIVPCNSPRFQTPTKVREQDNDTESRADSSTYPCSNPATATQLRRSDETIHESDQLSHIPS